MRVLVTGGAGYIGAVLVPALLERGYEVRVVDVGLFGSGHLPPQAEIIEADVLDFDEVWLDGVEAVIHLAGLSNDPMADFSPRLNYLYNAAAAAIAAQAAKAAGVNRFVLASSCSVYGLNDVAEVDEEHPVSPRFPYAVSKLMAERALLCLADETFHPIVLRKGTVVGWSPRMRYDLAANVMVKTALTQKKIVVHNPSLWRPFIDVRDVAGAYIRALDADPALSGIFNIARDNFSIGRLADSVAATLKEYGVYVPIEIQRRLDVRSYRVSLRKAQEVLDFHANVSMEDSVRAMLDHITAKEQDDFENLIYTNVEWLRANIASLNPASALAAVRP
ncbi:MAG: SDR family oxidoreductase [Dehalococcoidia bacterium]